MAAGGLRVQGEGEAPLLPTLGRVPSWTTNSNPPLSAFKNPLGGSRYTRPWKRAAPAAAAL